MANLQAVWKVPEPLSTVDVRVDEDTVITLRRHGILTAHGSS